MRALTLLLPAAVNGLLIYAAYHLAIAPLFAGIASALALH